MPPEHIEVLSDLGLYGNTGAQGFAPDPFGDETSLLDQQPAFASGYNSPGWGRLQKRQARPQTIDAVAEPMSGGEADFVRGERVFHQKFGYGIVASVDGDKLTIDFETGQKKVMTPFIKRA